MGQNCSAYVTLAPKLSAGHEPPFVGLAIAEAGDVSLGVRKDGRHLPGARTRTRGAVLLARAQGGCDVSRAR